MKSMIVAAVSALAVWMISAPGHAQPAYEPTLESMQDINPAPEWFRDAKVGIYFHWGVYSVPAFGSEWYPRNMHLNKRGENKHHLQTWGPIEKFGYADFVPMFKAEHFDAEEWADLFVQAGARFAGPVAEHHDGYAMWDSKVTPWNAVQTGPKKDLTGELEKAIRKRGMKFVATFHHARNNLWEINPGKWTGHYSGVKESYPALLDDPERAILYGYMPREQFLDMWMGKLKEVIDQYQPDLIWFDSWLHEIPEETRLQFLAYYYSAAKAWGREVVVTRKQNDLPLSVSLEDFEKGRADNLTENVWLTDDTLSKGSWCYTDNLAIKDADEVIDTLVDLVSKNGQLLLNISPMADGTIPQNQRDVLLDMGAWLKVNGEAIYNTRPWQSFGEGPTRMKKGGHFVGHVKYGARDIRYTRSKDGQVLYATLLGWPEAPFTLGHVRAGEGNAVVTLLGHEGPIKHEINANGQLVIHPPARSREQRPTPWAHAFKIEGLAFSLHEQASFDQGPGMVLGAEKALLAGEDLMLEEKIAGRMNVGRWDDPSASLHWLLPVKEAGSYRFRLEYANQMQAGHIVLETEGQTISTRLPPSGGWDKPNFRELGTLTFEHPGVYHLTLLTDKPATWNPVNVWEIQAARIP